MSLTQQQQTVIDTVKKEPLTLCSAIAGAGKTHTLVQLVKQLQPESGLYLAYNKKISDEAATKFNGTTIKCSTIHAMAYRAVVKQYGLNVGFFGVRDVHSLDGSTMPYMAKKRLVDTLEDFCLSSYIDPDEYLSNKLVAVDSELFKHYLDEFSNGTIQCSHSFYLKFYHILLANGTVTPKNIDLLLIDEIGDITELTLEIFKLLPASKKIGVGDEFQNIYGFNKTVNAFKVINEGTLVKLTESFRVSNKIAPSIEGFVRKHLDKTFEFKGHEYPEDTPIVTKGYISRNNSGLLAEMFRLMEESVKFNTTRPIDTILELPLILANLGSGKPVEGYQYKHIESLRQEWNADPRLKRRYSTVVSYVSRKLSDDVEVQNAYKVVIHHGPKDLNTLAKFVRSNSKTDTGLTLTTAHSSKGLEFDEVEIAPDLNQSTTKALVGLMDAKLNHKPKLIAEHKESLRLYYVAISRCKISLIDAKYAKVL